MLDKKIYDNYVWILEQELVPAMGCTEPIAIAYAAAKAKQILGKQPEKIQVWCSGNIIKNVKGVTVPNSGGLRGISAAAILGAIGGNPEKELEVLSDVTDAERVETKKLLQKKEYCECFLAENVNNLYIYILTEAGGESAEVEIEGKHTKIVRILKNKKIIFHDKTEKICVLEKGDRSLLNVWQIYEFANSFEIGNIYDIINRQIQYNIAIADEGLKHAYGAEVGRTLLERQGLNNVAVRACAKAAAGSDARMSGCPLPVIINSGSGNQGITVSVPVIEYAREMKASEEKLYRALVLANLISIHQKRYVGDLSAYCGATSAGCGAACGIAYLNGADYDTICHTITNTIATIGGMICDGAKASCAAKIAASVETAITAYTMSTKGRVFRAGEGLVEDDIEKTIQNFGRIGREGMRETDIDILKLMCAQG